MKILIILALIATTAPAFAQRSQAVHPIKIPALAAPKPYTPRIQAVRLPRSAFAPIAPRAVTVRLFPSQPHR